MCHSYFERKYDKVLTFKIFHFPNFEISASLLLAPRTNKRRTEKFKNLNNHRRRLLEEIR